MGHSGKHNIIYLVYLKISAIQWKTSTHCRSTWYLLIEMFEPLEHNEYHSVDLLSSFSYQHLDMIRKKKGNINENYITKSVALTICDCASRTLLQEKHVILSQSLPVS